MSVPYLSDRQRVEIAIPARLVLGLAACNCFSEPDADEVKKLKDLLLEACVQPLDGLDKKKAGQVARRIERICESCAVDFDQHSALKVGVALYYFLQDLLEREVLVLWEGSSFGEAMQLLMPMFEHGFAEHNVDRSAQKTARRLLTKLQTEGYYR
ncbi:hypothetical protein UFOVP32_45 [uncultured Caudovirales phage]|uniref:Uncharacterized protein n=1 Tax=uncultured Caudovirales phage TaxID=2100421 RepID=A0A6J5KMN8_9CAUD|nr:hypothetical protein UFOVP32_45 [uncultured Caudovirales phage]CAB4123635.1 hypothetical protein UFOVP50_31 [uncultured Caudovirales phage]